MQEALNAHLKTGSTTVCRAWLVRRKDEVSLGFTDHDRDLTFDGVVFVAGTGLTARALQQTTGMAVDNSEALGALSDAAVREEDILAGRYDGAAVTLYLVNWANVDERSVLFRGSFGEIVRSNGAFRVELRGLSDALNITSGRVYHSQCGAVLGDGDCGVDLTLSAHTTETPLRHISEGRILQVGPLPEFQAGWFGEGLAKVMTGKAAGQACRIKADSSLNAERQIELWQGFAVAPETGDLIRFTVGCDKRGSTCRTKFNNFLNFRGFPHIPGEDWLRSSPSRSGRR